MHRIWSEIKLNYLGLEPGTDLYSLSNLRSELVSDKWPDEPRYPKCTPLDGALCPSHSEQHSKTDTAQKQEGGSFHLTWLFLRRLLEYLDYERGLVLSFWGDIAG